MEILRRAESAALNEAIAAGVTYKFDPSKPWSTLFTKAVKDYAYWDEHLKEPCLLICSRARPVDCFVDGDCQVASSSSSHLATFGAIGEADFGTSRKRPHGNPTDLGGKKPRGAPAPPTSTSASASGNSSGQRHLTNRAGNVLCTAFNAGSCGGKGIQCPKDSSHRHLCNICLGPHSAAGPPACKGTFRPSLPDRPNNGRKRSERSSKK